MSGVHVVPEWESSKHRLEGTDCPCEPDVEWIDEDTGLPYPNGPLVVHCAMTTTDDHKKRWEATRRLREVARSDDFDEEVTS